MLTFDYICVIKKDNLFYDKVIQVYILYQFHIKFRTDGARLANRREPNPNVAQPKHYGTLSLKSRFTFI